MTNDMPALQQIEFRITGVRPRYTIIEAADEERGFEETQIVAVAVMPISPIPGLSVDFGLIELNAGRDLESPDLKREPDSSPGIGLVTPLKDALAVQAIMPADAAWRIASSIAAGQIGKAVVVCDPITGTDEQVYLREVVFEAG